MGSVRADCIQEENYAKIIEAAKKILSQKSARSATFTEIAAEAGVARRTVFNIFGTKNNLLILTADSQCKDLFAQLNEAAAGLEFARKSGLEQVVALHVLRAKYYYRRPHIVQLGAEVEGLALEGETETAHYAQYRQNAVLLFDYYWRAVQKGLRDGSVRKDVERDGVFSTLVFSFDAILQKLCRLYFNPTSCNQPDAVKILRAVLQSTRRALSSPRSTNA